MIAGRTYLPLEHKLFLAYIENTHKICSAKKVNVANWAKEIMKQAGIDTGKHGPHSSCSAVSTKAVEKGNSIENVKQHANWSKTILLQTNDDTHFGLANHKSNFFAENLTTLKTGAEATEVVLVTTSNQNFAKAKTENVTNAHPKLWFYHVEKGWMENTAFV